MGRFLLASVISCVQALVAAAVTLGMIANRPARQDRHLDPIPNSKPDPADPLSNPSSTPDLVPPDVRPEPLPNEPPVVGTPGAPTPVHPPAGPDHPLGPPEPIERDN
jgi:hypothetical protein